jgi:hypothetical protein
LARRRLHGGWLIPTEHRLLLIVHCVHLRMDGPISPQQNDVNCDGITGRTMIASSSARGVDPVGDRR